MTTAEQMSEAAAKETTSGGFSFPGPRVGYLLDAAQQEYERDPNALQAWIAWDEARRTKAELPAWARAYFDRVGENILRCLETYNRPSTKYRIRALVWRALEFGRRKGHRGNVFDDQQRRDWELKRIGPRMHELVAEKGLSVDAAAVEFAPVSATAVKAAYREYLRRQPRG